MLKRDDSVQQLDADLREYYRRDWRRLSLSTGFHLAGWLLGALEAYLILVFLEIPADLATATVIEALGAGVRFATFLVPASLGAFESANAVAFEAMGLGAGAGLAFSFVDARVSSPGPSSACSCSCPWAGSRSAPSFRRRSRPAPPPRPRPDAARAPRWRPGGTSTAAPAAHA